MEKKLSECLDACSGAFPYSVELNRDNDPLIDSIVFDSRKVQKNALFFALPGLHVHGNDFAEKAINAGAAAVVFEGQLPDSALRAAGKTGTVLIRTDNSRFVMSPLSAAFFNCPSKKLCIAGVTGTEGKSSTVFLIWQFLRLAGKKAGFISTVQYSFGDEAYDNPEHQTTPEAPIVQEYLYNMVQNGCEYAVVEASSHGLSAKTNRLGDVLFDAAAMMNVTHEHLEFHGSYEQYKNDKANLFANLASHNHEKNVTGVFRKIRPVAVVNAADGAAKDFVRAAQQIAVAGFIPPAVLNASGQYNNLNFFQDGSEPEKKPDAADVSLYKAGVYIIDEPRETESGIEFGIRHNGRKIGVQAPLAGAFNACNITAALLIGAGISGAEFERLARKAVLLKAVKGRMSRLDRGQPFDVFIDYAHTPSSFTAVFPPLRSKTKGRIISLFGSGGERDIQKRPIQGRIAAEYSDIVILTDEDPRAEDPMQLLEMIAAGCNGMVRGENLFLIPDRPAAIRKAFSLAQKGDSVLLLGKSHENSIIYKDKTIPYDETREAEKALAEAGFCTARTER